MRPLHRASDCQTLRKARRRLAEPRPRLRQPRLLAALLLCLSLVVMSPVESITIRTPSRPALHDAAKQGDLEQLTHALAQPGCEVDGRRLGFAAIHLAAKGGHTETISVLLDRGSTVHTKAANGASPLHCAAEANRTQVISMLLARGAVLNGALTYGDESSVLHVAAINGRLAATKLLVAEGADVHAKSKLGTTPFDDAVQLGRGRCPCEDPTAREWGAVAAFLGHVMPLDPAARVAFAQRAWERPAAAMFHDAAEIGDCARLLSLLDSGCDVDAADYDGSTAIHAAVEGGHLRAVSLLIDGRADVRATNNYNDSALHLAAREGHLAIGRLLVAKGADVHVQNRFGLSALEWAERSQSGEWEPLAVFLREEATDLADLPPAARAMRKVRAAVLAQQRAAAETRTGRATDLGRSVAPTAAADVYADVSARPSRPPSMPRAQPATARPRERLPLRYRPAEPKIEMYSEVRMPMLVAPPVKEGHEVEGAPHAAEVEVS